MDPLYVVSAVVVALTTFLLSQAILIVREGEMIVVERLGKFSSIKRPGFNWLVPFLERPRSVEWNRRVEVRQANKKVSIVDEKFEHYRIRTSNVVFDIPPVVCYSKEKVQIDVNIIVYYNITDLQKAVYQVGDLYASMESKVETMLINMVYEMSLEEITNQELQKQMTILLQREKWQEEWGVRINRFDIQNVVFPEQLSNATIDTVTMRRKLEAEKLSVESAKLKRMAELDSAEMVAEKQRVAELNRKAFELKQLQLDYEFQNVRLMKNAEVKISTEKSQQELDAERKRQKYQIRKESGMSEQYFIERMRTKSIGSIFEAGIKGDNKTLIIPLDALTNPNNGLLLNRLLSDQPPQETLVLNK